MGPSGAGKDSVLDLVKEQLMLTDMWLFIQRMITRPTSAGGENHQDISENTFKKLKKINFFSLDWYSHGLYYGIRDIDTILTTGTHIVVNGSREYFDDAQKKYPEIIPVIITAPTAMLAARLSKRGRETQEQIHERLARAGEFTIEHDSLITIVNDREVYQAADELLEALTGKKIVLYNRTSSREKL